MASLDSRTLQLLIDASLDGILILDADNCVEYANPAACQLLDRSARQLVGQPFGLPVVPGDKTEIDLHHVDPPAVVELRAGEAETAGGPRRIATLRDVTEAAAQVRQLLAEVTARSNALNLVAHELRSPLSVIVGYASMLDEGAAGELPEAAAHMLQQIAIKADSLRTTVEQLLLAARLDGHGIDSNRERLDPETAMTQAIERNQARAGLAGDTLHAADGVHGVHITADPDQVATILDNLIGNALVHCPTNTTVTLSVEWPGDPPDHTRVAILVSDDGPGIPAADQERIFASFERGAESEGRVGSGLGLAIARELAQVNDGDVQLLRSSANGSTFALVLPVTASGA
jgi:signal transduction histidine kinase